MVKVKGIQARLVRVKADEFKVDEKRVVTTHNLAEVFQENDPSYESESKWK